MSEPSLQSTRLVLLPPRSELAQTSFKSWLDQHLYGALSSLGRLWQNRLGTLLTMLVLGLAQTLPLLLYLLSLNLSTFSENLKQASTITIFLNDKLDAKKIETITKTIQQYDDVYSVALITPEQGLSELQNLSGFKDITTLLDTNPLPFALSVQTELSTSKPATQKLISALTNLKEVAQVQYDGIWHERTERVLELIHRAGFALTFLLSLGVLLVIGNSIRLDIESRTDEITITQLFGGTRRFVQRPFLYAGSWYGLGAGMIATLASIGVQSWLSPSVSSLARSYDKHFSLSILNSSAILGTLVISLGLGWMGAWIASQRQLAKSKLSQ